MEARRTPLLLTVLGLVIALVSGIAKAETSGTVSGCISANEVRLQLTNAAGSLHRSDTLDASGRIPLRGMLVRFDFIGEATAAGAGVTQLIPSVHTETDNNGCYQANWTDWTRVDHPTQAVMSVLWAHSNITGQTSTRPPEVFSIRGPTGSRLTSIRNFDLNANSTVNRVFAGGDPSAAFNTAIEFFNRNVRGGNGNASTLLGTRMTGIQILINQTTLFGNGGVAPFKDRVLITSGRPVAQPWSLAHELGHVATWQSLNLHLAPINPVFDYAPSGPSWNFLSRETERAAFLEGMASFFGTSWMWSRNSTAPVLFRAGFNFDFEAGTGTSTIAGVPNFSCATATSAHERTFCQAASMWDFFDNPAADDDPVQNRSQPTVANRLNAFPDGCPPWAENGCSNEGWGCGLNHLDFQMNLVVGDQPLFNAIRTMNGTGAGC